MGDYKRALGHLQVLMEHLLDEDEQCLAGDEMAHGQRERRVPSTTASGENNIIYKTRWWFTPRKRALRETRRVQPDEDDPFQP